MSGASTCQSRSCVVRCAVGALFALPSSGCEGDGVGARPDTSSFEAGVETPAPGCTQRDDGEVCGESMHCFSQRCVDDECGDGILSAGEACDDGNLAWGDGCDAACAFERPGCPDGVVEGDEECDDGNWNGSDACTNLCLAPRRCGNGRVEPGEDCDDGNVIDGDFCSNQCLASECRDGHLDPREECDDGNTVDQGDGCTNGCKLTVCGNGKVEKFETCDDGNTSDGDTCPATCIETVCGNGIVEPAGGEVCEGARVLTLNGKTARRGCSADCRHWVEGDDDACNKCQNEKCAAWMGIDLVDGCFNKINSEFGADASDPFLIQSCSDLVDCAFEHGCGFTKERQLFECYCGSNSQDDCVVNGPAADAPCKQELLTAAKAAEHNEAYVRLTDLAYAVGWANFLLECYREDCGDVCIPRTTAVIP